jgi:Kdo2-lipid IVA lauroyltransferase/acyltransferase
LPDQHVAEGGIVAEFLGRPAMTATGPANLAARTGCAVLPAFCLVDSHGSMKAEILPPLQFAATGNRDADVATNTQLVNDAIGRQIRKHPDQWLWFHRRWKMAD